MRVIAIDGPAGSGKSTVARAVARRLEVPFLDTGAMYRAVALACLRAGVDPDDADAVAGLGRGLDVGVGASVTLDGDDVTEEIRGAPVNAVVSAVAAHPEVRSDMVRRQREWASANDGGVVEGRDIGSVVFPDADLKVFLTASDDERARRRRDEDAAATGTAVEVAAVAADLARRDRLDSTRPSSPLTIAEGALVIDTTGRSVDEVVDEIVAHAGATGTAGPARGGSERGGSERGDSP